MDGQHFDALVRTLSKSGTRRGLLAALPMLGALFDLLDSNETDAAGRRKRRKKRHKHGKGNGRNRKGKRKKTRCTPESAAQTCAGTCGIVKNTCKKTVDCGVCACNPPCDACLVCNETTLTCWVDPNQVGDSCGQPGQVCQGDGSCACSVTPNTCQGESCCGSACADLQSDPEHCGACGTVCGTGHICQGGVCGVSCGSGFCPAATEICVDGACVACDVTCSGTAEECGAALQAAIDAPGTDATVYVCPGIYRGGFHIAHAVTVIGAGQGDDETAHTILHGHDAARVIFLPDAFQTVGLQRLRITGGRTTDEFIGGAGILNVAKLLVMTDCTVSDNHTNFRSTSSAGGAISNVGFSRMEMSGCTISANSVTNGDVDGQAFGAGIYNTGPGLTMTDCVVRDNTATGARNNGAGIYSSNIARLTNCRVTENRLTTPNDASSGGITVAGILGSVTLTDSFVWNNTAPDCSGNITGSGCGTAPPA